MAIPLFVSLKDKVSKALKEPDLANCFRQIEIWANSLASTGGTDPVGVVKATLASTPDTNYLFLDGSTHPVSSYPIFAKRVYNLTSGSFTLPDARGRVLAGFLTGDPNFGTLRGTVGEAAHVLSIAELAAHNHSDTGHNHTGTTGNNSVNHTHQSGINTGTTGSTGVLASTTASNNGQWNTGINSVAHTHAFTTANGNAAISNTGSGTGHNNIQPSLVINWEVKVA